MKLRERLSLRARISLVLVVVVAVALAAANVAVYAFASTFLDQRVDEQLAGLSGPAVGLVFRPDRPDRPEPDRVIPGGTDRSFRGRVSSVDITGAYVEARTADGRRLDGRYLLTTTAEQRTPPELPSSFPVAPEQHAVFDTVANDGDTTVPYRVRASALPDGTIVFAALPLTDLEATRARLVLIEVLATLAVLALVAGLTWWLVGVGLKPLERMEDTAERIAQGDLSQRVEPSGTGTEIARLGAALNGMLTEIETAFAAKDVSEQKLRRFVADASHELRTPLTSIRGYAELLRRGTVQDPTEVAAAARRIEQEASRLGSLVEDLLLLARLDEGAGVVRVPVDVARVVADVVDDARIIDPSRTILLKSSGSTIVEGDQNRLTQVVTNLVANARVHTPPGTPIEVGVRTTTASTRGPVADDRAADLPKDANEDVGSERDVVVVEVVDHGPGIEPEKVARVFDRFFRADASRSRDRGGSGLGLAIVAAIVDAHDGRCEVDETPGGGATFRVILPRSVGDADDRSERRAEAENQPAVVGTYVTEG